MAISPSKRLFTVDEFYRMADAGIFREDDRLELLDGEIIEMTPIGPPHAACVTLLNRLLIERLGRRAVVTPQNPARLDDLTEPQPDLCIARWRDDGYATAHPRPDDLLLVVEVADTSLPYDRDRKAPRYALARIPETWVIDLNAEAIHAFRGPSDGRYGVARTFGRNDTIDILAFPDIRIAVDDIIPGTNRRPDRT